MNDIPFDPDLIAPGNFFEKATIKAVKLLLDERKVDFDALLAVNDKMALSALLEFQKRGMCAPKDIAIIDFDDPDIGKISNPALTTIHQPRRSLGRNAAKFLLDWINGKPI